MARPRSRLYPILLALVMAAPVSALADTSRADAEQDIDTGLKEFGYLAGLSRGCVASEQEAVLEGEVLDLHASIGRLLGTDRAFLFAAAFGYGSALQTPTAECKDVLSRYETRAASLRNSTEKAR